MILCLVLVSFVYCCLFLFFDKNMCSGFWVSFVLCCSSYVSFGLVVSYLLLRVSSHCSVVFASFCIVDIVLLLMFICSSLVLICCSRFPASCTCPVFTVLVLTSVRGVVVSVVLVCSSHQLHPPALFPCSFFVFYGANDCAYFCPLFCNHDL